MPRVATGTLDEFDENAAGGARMQKGDEVSLGSAAGLGVDEFVAFGGEGLERGADVRDTVGEVVQAGTASSEEAPDRRIGPGWGQQLDPPGTGSDEDDLDALVFEGLAFSGSRPDESFPDGDYWIERGYGDPNVVEDVLSHWRMRHGSDSS